MKTLLRSFIATVLATISLASVHASEPGEISWDDLMPPPYAADSPLANLTPTQQSDLNFIVQVQQYKKAGVSEDDNGYADVAKEIEAELRGTGLDVDVLLAEARKTSQVQDGVVPELNGKNIRMPGYVLPLEYEGDVVKEFLLVPYVGACIHTPPPPENQIVYVKLDQGVKISKMYEPVWATGLLKTVQSKQSVSLVDGTTNVSVGYQLQGTKIEPYEE